MGITEHSIQVRLIQYVRTFYPEIIIFAIPNGGGVSAINRVNLVKEGLLSGVPDLFIAQYNDLSHGLFIEMKKEGGIISKEQNKIMEKLVNKGYQCEVCYDFKQALDCIEKYCLVESTE